MGGKRSILVVDDDSDWLDFMAEVLGDAYEVRAASSGEEALRMARDLPPAAMILDVLMPPGMDGFRVLCELRKAPETRDIPVVMLTSVNAVTDSAFDAEVLDQYLGTAPAEFLEKPVTPADLQAAVAQLLGDGGRP